MAPLLRQLLGDQFFNSLLGLERPCPGHATLLAMASSPCHLRGIAHVCSRISCVARGSIYTESDASMPVTRAMLWCGVCRLKCNMVRSYAKGGSHGSTRMTAAVVESGGWTRHHGVHTAWFESMGGVEPRLRRGSHRVGGVDKMSGSTSKVYLIKVDAFRIWNERGRACSRRHTEGMREDDDLADTDGIQGRKPGSRPELRLCT